METVQFQRATSSAYAFAGRTWDLSADLYFNERRFYDPSTGRFLNEDPAQDGSNWYRYAGNDPINFRDPTGLTQAGNPLNNLYGSSMPMREGTSAARSLKKTLRCGILIRTSSVRRRSTTTRPARLTPMGR